MGWRLRREWLKGLALMVVLAAAACGGKSSHVPEPTEAAMASVDNALEAGDAVEICGTLRTLENQLYQWQSQSRGNFPARLERSIQRLQGVGSACYTMQPAEPDAAPELDITAVEDGYQAWKDELRDWSRVKSNWLTLFLWTGGPLIITGILMFLKRKLAP